MRHGFIPDNSFTSRMRSDIWIEYWRIIGSSSFEESEEVQPWKLLGGGNSTIFYVHPDPWGNDPIWRAYYIFHVGWNKPPARLTWNPKNEGLEDDLPFQNFDDFPGSSR